MHPCTVTCTLICDCQHTMIGSNHAKGVYCCLATVAMYCEPVECALNLQVITKLHSILKPFLLRRVKSDVENSLPGKKELIVYADMTQQQRDFNEELRQNTLNVSAADPLMSACTS